MGKIEIDIPRHLEKALEDQFPGKDKSTALLQLIERELGQQSTMDVADERNFDDLVTEALRLRKEPPYVTDDTVRRIRGELRE